MGTAVTVEIRDPVVPRRALQRAFGWLRWVDRTFSTYDAESEISRLNAGDLDLADAHPLVRKVLARCEALRAGTDGYFDVSAPLRGRVDPSGLVKGWAVDKALRMLDQAGVPAALVNGGGDLAAFGMPGPGRCWRAGIRHPWRAAGLAAVLEVYGAVATSASYERGAHLVDPRTGQPGGQAASATVTGPSLAQADALATGLAVGGDAALEVITGLPGYQAYLIRPDGSESWTPGMEFAEA